MLLLFATAQGHLQNHPSNTGTGGEPSPPRPPTPSKGQMLNMLRIPLVFGGSRNGEKGPPDRLGRQLCSTLLARKKRKQRRKRRITFRAFFACTPEEMTGFRTLRSSDLRVSRDSQRTGLGESGVPQTTSLMVGTRSASFSAPSNELAGAPR